MNYTIEFGSYYLRDEDGGILYMCDQVALAYDEKEGCLLKHGSPFDVGEWWEKNRRAAPGLFSDIRVMTLPRGFDVDEINRCINNATYVAVLAKRLQEAGA